MKLSLKEIEKITKGAVRIEQGQEGISFSRFTTEQELFYKEYCERNTNSNFYSRARANSGIKFEFETDSTYLKMRFYAINRVQINYFSVDVFVNGEKSEYIYNFPEEVVENESKNELIFGNLSEEIFLGNGKKTIEVCFPWSAQIILKEISLDDGSLIEATSVKKKILMYGDSITQGYYAVHTSNRYTYLLSKMLGAEEVNKSIAGECFRPEFAKLKDDFSPDLITVAYGTNDWKSVTEEDFKKNTTEFFKNISENYPSVKIFAISPIWRKDHLEKEGFGQFKIIEEHIKEAAEHLENVIFISGFDLVPHDEKYFGDLRLHPNDEGFKHYAENLYKKIIKLI